MKRSVYLAVLTASFLVGLALPAAADYPPSGVDTSPAVLPNVIHAPSATAFTGSMVLPLVVVAAALLLTGASLLLVARRRNAARS